VTIGIPATETGTCGATPTREYRVDRRWRAGTEQVRLCWHCAGYLHSHPGIAITPRPPMERPGVDPDGSEVSE
jgi:hypothetical protein